MNMIDCDLPTLSTHLFPPLPGLLEATASKSTRKSSPSRSTLFLLSKLESSAVLLPCSPFNSLNGKAFARGCWGFKGLKSLLSVFFLPTWSWYLSWTARAEDRRVIVTRLAIAAFSSVPPWPLVTNPEWRAAFKELSESEFSGRVSRCQCQGR